MSSTTLAQLAQQRLDAVACARRIGRLALSLVLLAQMPIALAAPGVFDTSFGNGGVASFALPNGSGVAHDLAQSPDGSLLVEGSRGFDPLLVKLFSNGQLDTTFATNGFDSTRHGTQLVQEGILIAATPPSQFTAVEFHGNPLACQVPFFFAVCIFRDLASRRINANGAADPSYGTNGFVLIPKSEGSVALSPTGSLIGLTMRPQAATPPVFGVVALRADGTEDTALEQRALAALNCGPQFAAGSRPVGVTRWSGGKLLVAMGVAPTQDLGAPHTLCVSRLNDDGSLDTSFATNGHLLFQTSALVNHFPFKILVRSDGRILIVLLDGAPRAIHNPAFVWLTPNGALDTAVVSGGLVFPAPVLVASVVDVSLEADDKILVAGYNAASPGTPAVPLDGTTPILARLESNGSTFDATFGPTHMGFRTLTIGPGWLSPQKVVAGSGSDIFVLGTLVNGTPAPADPFGTGDFAVAKLHDAPDAGSGDGGGGGGCAMIQGLPGGPIDPTLPLLLFMALLWTRRAHAWHRRTP